MQIKIIIYLEYRTKCSIEFCGVFKYKCSETITFDMLIQRELYI